MKKPHTPARRSDPAVVFRSQIEAALSNGASAGKMVLKLTLSDASHMKRDPNVATTDIGFADGAMRYLGVPVEQGGVSVSVLETGLK